MKRSLITATGTFDAAKQNKLPTSNVVAEAVELSTILRDPGFGNYEIKYSLDNNRASLFEHLQQFFRSAIPDDELLLFYSGHGLRAADGSLLLTAANTVADDLSGTTIPSSLLCELSFESKSRQIGIVIDCCFSKGLIRAFDKYLSDFRKKTEGQSNCYVQVTKMIWHTLGEINLTSPRLSWLGYEMEMLAATNCILPSKTLPNICPL
jgi:hypothetical protein